MKLWCNHCNMQVYTYAVVKHIRLYDVYNTEGLHLTSRYGEEFYTGRTKKCTICGHNLTVKGDFE